MSTAACKLEGGIFNQGIQWNIQNGKSAQFWWDFWLSSETCGSLISSTLTKAEFSLLVADVHPFWEEWHFEKLSFVLLDFIINEIYAIPLSLNPNFEDKIIWAFSPTGFFSLKSAYILAKGLSLTLLPNRVDSTWIWKTCTTPRIHFFVWLCFHNSLPTC